MDSTESIIVLSNSVSIEEINLDSFKNEIIKSRINLNDSMNSSVKLDIQNKLSKEFEINEIGTQIYVLPGDDYFNKTSKLDYLINLTVNDETNKEDQIHQKKYINIKIDYKFPIN
jgi:hypothetical protein